VLVGWQPIGRRCNWWPTGAAPASLIPVVAIVFHLRFVGCHNKGIFIIIIYLLHCISLNIFSIHTLQFGFKKDASCSHALFVLSQTVNYFEQQGTNVFMAKRLLID